MVAAAGGLLPALAFGDAYLPAGPEIQGGALSDRQFQLGLQRLKDLKKSLFEVEWGTPLPAADLTSLREEPDSDFEENRMGQKSTATSRILFSSLPLC
jgi:hypothetical protein